MGWGGGRGCCWEQNTTVLGIYKDGRFPVIQDHTAQGLTREREALYYYLSYVASINIFFLLLFLLFIDLVYRSA